MIIFNEKKSKNSSLTLFMLHIPVLILLVGALAGVTFFSSRKFLNDPKKESELSTVLGDDDDEDEDEDSDEDRDDEDEDDNDNDDGEDSDEDENDEDEDEDDNEDRDDEDESEDEDEDEDRDDEDDNDNEDESTRRIQNPDGTYSIVKKEQEEGKLKFEIVTYDASGNRIRVEKYERDNGKEEARVKVYNPLSGKISDFKLKTEDGKELELRLKEDGRNLSRVSFDSENNELEIREKSIDGQREEPDMLTEASRVRIKLDGDNFVITRGGSDVKSRFPMVVDDETGIVSVQTPNKLVELKVMPDSILQKINSVDDVDEISEVELSSDDDSELEYKVHGTKSEDLLGLFSIKIPSILIFDAQTGEFVKTDQALITKILDLLSF